MSFEGAWFEDGILCLNAVGRDVRGCVNEIAGANKERRDEWLCCRWSEQALGLSDF